MDTEPTIHVGAMCAVRTPGEALAWLESQGVKPTKDNLAFDAKYEVWTASVDGFHAGLLDLTRGE